MRVQPPIIPYRVPYIALLAGLLLLSGCMSFLHPHAEEWYRQAKGATAPHTVLNLIAMMESTAQQATVTSGEGSTLNDLHHQFHALHTTLDSFSGEQAAAAVYEFALTLQEELRTILHRLWKLQGNSPLRDMHLHLFLLRLQELRKAVQSIPA